MDQDVNMHDADIAIPPLLLSEDETRLLSLYDNLRQLQLEIAMLQARQSFLPDSSSHAVQEDIIAGQEQLLETRGMYTLRNDVVDAVLSANPILKAVHHATQATPIDRDLLQHVEQRDEVSTTAARQSATLRGALDHLTELEVEGLRLSQENVGLASEVLRLAAEASQAKAGSMNGSAIKRELERLERDLKMSRQRWKVMKGTASAVVAGSGVDWVRDPELSAIVLDSE